MIVSNLQKQAKSRKADTSQTSSAAAATVQHEGRAQKQTRELAFQMFENRGSGHGHDLQDWFRAERQLQAQ
ncbi:MAG: DUF2934 domain-containing protein [Terracidiphilus sp.]|jgi:hypothetical protein